MFAAPEEEVREPLPRRRRRNLQSDGVVASEYDFKPGRTSAALILPHEQRKTAQWLRSQIIALELVD